MRRRNQSGKRGIEMYLIALLLIFFGAMIAVTLETNDTLRLPYAILWGSYMISIVLLFCA